jgi:peptidoglycan/LPS O-acetylase OafA/YrhL
MYLLLEVVDFYGLTAAWTRLLAGSATIMLPAAVFAFFDRPLRDGLQRILAGRKATARATGA